MKGKQTWKSLMHDRRLAEEKKFREESKKDNQDGRQANSTSH